MNLLIMGLPGCGKGTQSELLVEEYGVLHLSTGNIFRKEIEKNSELGTELNSFIKEGKLVPDELTIKILKEELLSIDISSGFLFDGFPRTIRQAKELDNMLTDINYKLDGVIYVDLDETVIIDRLANRYMCSNCQSTYNLINKKPKVENICDLCDGELIQREDDKPKKIKTRIDIAKQEMGSILNYYKEQGILLNVEMLASDSISDVFDKIKLLLKDVK